MEKETGRWRRPGVLLATALFIAVAVYFLVLFVKQSLNLYDLMQQIQAQERRVAQIEQENEALRKRWEGYKQNCLLAVKRFLAYKEPGEKVAVFIEKSAGQEAGRPETEKAESFREELAALPTWQKWLWIIFVGAEH